MNQLIKSDLKQVSSQKNKEIFLAVPVQLRIYIQGNMLTGFTHKVLKLM